jgi:hypothetical protein
MCLKVDKQNYKNVAPHNISSQLDLLGLGLFLALVLLLAGVVVSCVSKDSALAQLCKKQKGKQYLVEWKPKFFESSF